MDPPRFDLRTESWIPCRSPSGELLFLGIRDALCRAHEFVEVDDPSPLTTAALLRLLLAVLHAAHGRPWLNRHRMPTWRQGQWDPAVIDRYLFHPQLEDRFDLFHTEHPFYQDPGFSLPKPTTCARLMPERTSGISRTLFDHTLDADPPPLSPAAAARALVTHQMFSLGGGHGVTRSTHGKHANLRSAPAALGAVISVRGHTLFETEWANMLPYDEGQPLPSSPDDAPLWEREQFPSLDAQLPTGYLAYLTWPNRCVRLYPEPGVDGWLVRRVDDAQGPHLPKSPQPLVLDPFFSYTTAPDGRWRPLRLRAERALWRDSTSLFGFAASPTPPRGPQPVPAPRPRVLAALATLGAHGVRVPLNCTVTGMDSLQAKIRLWRQESLPLPWALLEDPRAAERVARAVAHAERLGKTLEAALRQMARCLERWLDPSGADGKSVGRRVQGWGAMRRYWADLETPFREFLGNLSDHPDTADRGWLEAVQGTGARAFRQAESLAGTDPRAMRARAEGLTVFSTGRQRIQAAIDSKEETDVDSQ